MSSLPLLLILASCCIIPSINADTPYSGGRISLFTLMDANTDEVIDKDMKISEGAAPYYTIDLAEVGYDINIFARRAGEDVGGAGEVPDWLLPQPRSLADSRPPALADHCGRLAAIRRTSHRSGNDWHPATRRST